MREFMWGMLLVLMASIFTSSTVTAQNFSSESVIDENTGATANFARSVELISGERLNINVSTESILPWTLKVTQTDSAGKELVTEYNGGVNEEKKIRKDFTSPGHYTLELTPNLKLSTRSFLPVDLAYTPTINWHVLVTKYKPMAASGFGGILAFVALLCIFILRRKN